MSGERLHKVLARAGVASRRASEELIRAGRVTVNGGRATIGQTVDAERDAIKVDGRRVRVRPPSRYLLLHKPDGFLTTRSDPEGRPTVFDLVPPGLRRGLIAVGRLDFHSEGLLLLTDDGEFAQRVAHPRYGCTKTYEVKVKGAPEAATLGRLRRGVVIAGRKTSPARVEPLAVSGRRSGANTWWRVELREGRPRQIREMFYRVGHPVRRLRRVAIGSLSDPRLPPGSYREVTAEERRSLLGGRAPAARRRRAAPRRRRRTDRKAG